jgi:DNA-binding MarR family transcriptional regulator
VHVLRLAALLQAAGDALARPAGQTSARWLVLAAIEDAPAPVAEIARMLGFARQSVQRVADRLVRDGLATYARNPEHRRAQLVRLTAGGRRALRTIQAAQCGWADALGAELGAASLRGATALLTRAERLLARED